jgi:hypothetical protein
MERRIGGRGSVGVSSDGRVRIPDIDARSCGLPVRIFREGRGRGGSRAEGDGRSAGSRRSAAALADAEAGCIGEFGRIGKSG